MKEVTFIRQNIEKWKRAETMVEQAESLSPDELADAYTELTQIWLLPKRIPRFPHHYLSEQSCLGIAQPHL